MSSSIIKWEKKKKKKNSLHSISISIIKNLSHRVIATIQEHQKVQANSALSVAESEDPTMKDNSYWVMLEAGQQKSTTILGICDAR